MKRFWLGLLGCLLIFCLGNVVMYVSAPRTGQEEIEHHYLTSEGLVKTYPGEEAGPFLSESVGLYLQWLLSQHDAKRFARQVDVLRRFFIVEVEGELFVQWKTGEVKVNAFIDDARIVDSLFKGAELFSELSYKDLADHLRKSILRHQVVGEAISEFYDWDKEQAAPTMVFSYLDTDLLAAIGISFQPTIPADGAFYAEKQMIDTRAIVSREEAHMVDQLLAAAYCLKAKCENEAFAQWFDNEIVRTKALFGRYDKTTKGANVIYESRAVYALAVRYLRGRNPTLATQLAREKSDFFNPQASPDMHFFDFIHPLLNPCPLSTGC